MPTNRQAEIAGLVRQILEQLGYDPSKGSLRDTPTRVAKFLIEATHVPEFKWAIFDEPPRIEGGGQMVVVGPIDFSSLCEHHMLPFTGKAWVGYIPSVSGTPPVRRFVGLSKLARLVRCHAAGLQIQERITENVAEALYAAKDSAGLALAPAGVGVVIQASHQCMCIRGAKAVEAQTRTQALRGCFFDAPVRAEFLAQVASL